MTVVLTPHQHTNFLEPALQRFHAGENETLITGTSGAGKTASSKVFLAETGLRPFSFARYFEQRKKREEPQYQENTFIGCAVVRRAAEVMRSRGIPARTLHSVAYSPFLNRTPEELDNLTRWHQQLEALETSVRARVDGRMTATEQEQHRAVCNLIEEMETPDYTFSPQVLNLTTLMLVDEATMVPSWMRDDLRTAVCPKIYTGDHAQNHGFQKDPDGRVSEDWFLPPLMHGRLTQIMRQAEGSGVLGAAMRVRAGKSLSPWGRPYGRDGMMIHQQAGHAAWLLQNMHVAEDGFVVVDVNWLRADINKMCRLAHGRRAWLPVIGDRVVMTKNSEHFSNGDVLVIDHVHGYDPMVNAVLVDAHALGSPMSFTGLALNPRHLAGLYGAIPSYVRGYGESRNRLGLVVLGCEYGFAVTCHKAQGGERDHVAVIASNWCGGNDDLHRRRWLYTAITRARLTCDLFFYGIGEGRDLDAFWNQRTSGSVLERVE